MAKEYYKAFGFSRIILMSDFSDSSRNAILYAIQAFGTGVDYVLVNTYFAKKPSAMLIDLNGVLAEESKKKLQTELQWINSKFLDLNLKIQTHSIFGKTNDALQKLTKDSEYNIVVIGSKGKSDAKSSAFGNVSVSILKKSKIPVLVIPSSYFFTSLKEIVLAIKDESITGSQEFETLLRIQKMNDSNITEISISNSIQKEHRAIKCPSANQLIFSTTIQIDELEIISRYCHKRKINLLAVQKGSDILKNIINGKLHDINSGAGSLPILSLR